MTKVELVDALIESEEENKELTERLRVACETIEQLKRVNKEWETLWIPIDDLVRPITPLGGCVGTKAVELITGILSATPVGYVQQFVVEKGLDGYTATLNPEHEGKYIVPVFPLLKELS